MAKDGVKGWGVVMITVMITVINHPVLVIDHEGGVIMSSKDGA